MTLSRRTLAPGEHVRVHNPEDGSLLYRVHVLKVTPTKVVLGFEEPESAVVAYTNTLTSHRIDTQEMVTQSLTIREGE